MKALRAAMGKHSDIVMVLLVLGVLVVLFAPIPSWALDFLILTNFSFAFLVLLLTFYMARPVEFSTFPSLLLIATLFRLSLNVAASPGGERVASRILNATQAEGGASISWATNDAGVQDNRKRQPARAQTLQCNISVEPARIDFLHESSMFASNSSGDCGNAPLPKQGPRRTAARNRG